MPGCALALCARDELAEGQRCPVAELGTGAVTLAQNCRDVAEVGAVFQSALDAGATSLKRPGKAAWGGTAGYLADPDGHVWEIAHNPFWPLAGGRGAGAALRVLPPCYRDAITTSQS